MRLQAPCATTPEAVPVTSRHRVLVDLSHAAAGYVGIAQDVRMIFSMLADLPGVDVAGLLMPTGRHDLPRIGPKLRSPNAMTAGVLHWMARNWESRSYPRMFGRIGRLLESRHALRSDYALLRLSPSERTAAIWRVLFEKTLPPDRRAHILAHDFYATDLSVMRIIDRLMLLPGLPPKRLAADGFDFVFFCMPRPVRLPPGVRQLVRFHDAVPVTDTDTVSSWRTGVAHQRLVEACDPAAVFVCNSPQTLEDLAGLDPRRAERARVVPCAIAPLPDHIPAIPFATILDSRRSFRALGKSATEPKNLPPPDARPRYVLAISTLEPRKNYPGLIRGWERVLARSDPELRLVIVANSGWLEEPVLRAMAPHVRRGRILHLEGLPYDELVSLMRQAACFAFPSFNEGFGYAPLEALQAGTPCVVSDIPVFRWIFGDGAVYVDPYDPEAIAGGIERLTTAPGHEDLRRELLARREGVIDRFRPSVVRQQWAALLDELKRPAPARA